MSDAKIVIVDDNLDILNTLKILISECEPNFDVFTFLNAKSAFEHMETDPPDILITDLMMPGINGWELTSMIKNSETLSEIPIIYLTASQDKHFKEAGEYIGESYIKKPFDEGTLMETLWRVIRKGKR